MQINDSFKILWLNNEIRAVYAHAQTSKFLQSQLWDRLFLNVMAQTVLNYPAFFPIGQVRHIGW